MNTPCSIITRQRASLVTCSSRIIEKMGRQRVSRSCSGVVDDDVTFTSHSDKSKTQWSEFSDGFSFPILLACGVLASSVSFVEHSRGSSPAHSQMSNSYSTTKRHYSSSSTLCESNSKPPKDSFFDMAQQWALENLPNKSKDAQQTLNERNNSEPTSNAKETGIFSSPEQLLKVIGAFGSQNSSNNVDIDVTEPPDIKRNTFNVDSLQRYVDKIQDVLMKPSSTDTAPMTQDNTRKEDSAVSDFISFFFSSDKQSSSDMNELIRQAHNIVNPVSGSSMTSTGFLDQLLYFKKNSDDIQNAFEASFGQLFSSYGLSISDLFEKMNIATLHYYLEHQDSIKTPSWKRRVHRFYSDVEVEKVEELNEALLLSELSYADSVEEVREGLESISGNKSDDKGSFIAERFRKSSNKPQWELLFCDIESRPNEPSHFLAVQKNASKYDDTLHVLMCVRGTKSMSDLMTDALLDATDYEYMDETGDVLQGKAHGGMVKAGKYLVKRHETLLSTLLELSNKCKIEINLIGHSMGAGAATIAAMEWNSKGFIHSENRNDNKTNKDIEISAHVIGFGCPAILSKPLSIATRDYCTTVIADADMIPRMSGATLVNLILDLMTFDYRDKAERDVEQALKELQYRFGGSDLPEGKKSKLSISIEDESIQKVMAYIHQGLDKVIAPSNVSSDKSNGKELKMIKEFQKLEPMLFPPGTCIHFYRDGSAISGAYTPCTFYNEVRCCCYISFHTKYTLILNSSQIFSPNRLTLPAQWLKIT